MTDSADHIAPLATTERCPGCLPDDPAAREADRCERHLTHVTLTLTIEQAYVVRTAMFDHRMETRRYLGGKQPDSAVPGCECANCRGDRARAMQLAAVQRDLTKRLEHDNAVIAMLPRFPAEIDDEERDDA